MIPAIFGLSGTSITDSENAFFKACDPAGFILFRRNIDTPSQVKTLTQALRDCVGRAVPIFVDQEGGRVQRLGPPNWRTYPPMRLYGSAADAGYAGACRALRLHGRLLADDLIRLGIDVNCAPVLDRPVDGSDAVIGDRALSAKGSTIISLGRIIVDAMAQAGVQSVIKHMPGHGRAEADSHLHLPIVHDSAADLEADIEPFRALADVPYAMTAHVAYRVWDGDVPATLSKVIIGRIMRMKIGYRGLLITDDLSMKALKGDMASRVEKALHAGCDLLLHCNGDMTEMEQIAAAAGTTPTSTREKIEDARMTPDILSDADRAALIDEFDAQVAACEAYRCV